MTSIARNDPFTADTTARPKPAGSPKAARAGADIESATLASGGGRIRSALRGDLVLYAVLILLLGSAWEITNLGLVDSRDELSYWIAVAGGSMMLALFVYPLRKYFRFMAGLGKVKWWFWFHLCMGITGPWLILVHSGFQTRSLNAGVALYSMLIVVGSGIIGRFIYVRVHRGLSGERTSLRELSERAGLVESEARSRLHFSPKVEARLLAFEQEALRPRPGRITHLRQAIVLPVQQWFTYLACSRELRRTLNTLAKQRQWDAGDLLRRKRHSRRLVERYLGAVVRVAQFTAYERLFSLWHLAHLPFIYLLVISAVVHVIAVHAY